MKTTLKFAALAFALALPFSAQAHKAWLLPSSTVVTPNEYVTVDAAVSNDIFYFNHVPLRIDNLVVTAPDGSVVKPENLATGKYRTTFDLQLAQSGTYRLSNGSRGLSASYLVGTETKRWRGTAEAFAKEVPADAKDLQVLQSQTRVETFITAGKPSALKADGTGLELVPVTHPNDLFAGEAARFKLTIDGQPAPGLKITIVPEGIRYRAKQDEMTLTSDGDGAFSVTWPQAGRYWLEVVTTDGKTSLPQAKQRRLSYVATLEVLPQ
ncbi:DUF4198 domain-containing protein [Arenimonas oryziterrae]|uniref:ABC transporter permease n=1 Tax=Arenimonas oryziterrae DSM 21050 = YC6267 TaxID=1121015 RepID=A0A091AX36_9GAMM|nr:DUF4198 domain-containing protein [Arenimonas oryziterrae]KFN43847.1 hypothetical protein N789_07830 [Arenimonas oryziterrae DSM 21050 = YC6267]